MEIGHWNISFNYEDLSNICVRADLIFVRQTSLKVSTDFFLKMLKRISIGTNPDYKDLNGIFTDDSQGQEKGRYGRFGVTDLCQRVHNK